MDGLNRRGDRGGWGGEGVGVGGKERGSEEEKTVRCKDDEG